MSAKKVLAKKVLQPRSLNDILAEIMSANHTPIAYNASGVIVTIHPPEDCHGDWCVFHNPSEHPMRDWPRYVDERRVTMRHCPHGLVHPDPDSVAYFVRIGRLDVSDHTPCDNCCGRNQAISEEQMQEAWDNL